MSADPAEEASAFNGSRPVTARPKRSDAQVGQVHPARELRERKPHHRALGQRSHPERDRHHLYAFAISIAKHTEDGEPTTVRQGT